MKEFIIREKYDLYDAMEEIMEVWKVSKLVKIQASSMRTKTNQQLRYYWGVIIPRLTTFYNETGLCSMTITKADTNDILNQKFFYEEVRVGNEIERVVKSKSGATKEQMMKFIDNVIHYCTNLGVEIPPPTNGSVYD